MKMRENRTVSKLPTLSVFADDICILNMLTNSRIGFSNSPISVNNCNIPNTTGVPKSENTIHKKKNISDLTEVAFGNISFDFPNMEPNIIAVTVVRISCNTVFDNCKNEFKKYMIHANTKHSRPDNTNKDIFLYWSTFLSNRRGNGVSILIMLNLSVPLNFQYCRGILTNTPKKNIMKDIQ